ncbi:MAG: hypothetical protein ACYSX0_03385 [Planctomycetota bacterium]
MRRLLASLAGLGLIGCAIAPWFDVDRALGALLVAFAFVLTIVMGMLFFVLLQHVTDAGWSVVVRRWAEQFLSAIPILALFLLPILIGVDELFAWADEARTFGDHLYEIKRPYLNVPFFIVRAAIYFGLWFWLARMLRGRSLEQDRSADPAISLKLRRLSAPGLIAYGVVLTFAAFDWLMTLDYHWFSTIFGVYVFAHGTVAALAVLSILAVAFRRGPLRERVGLDTVHDLGRLTFAFAIFWAYIAFSQWMLIYYANIPEETLWLIERWEGAWKVFVVLYTVGLFVVPFVVLMPAAAKRNGAILTSVCIGILVAHYLGLYWIVMPTLPGGHFEPAGIWIDLAAFLLVAGGSGLVVARAMGKDSLYPLNDPRLKEATAQGAEG